MITVTVFVGDYFIAIVLMRTRPREFGLCKKYGQ